MKSLKTNSNNNKTLVNREQQEILSNPISLKYIRKSIIRENSNIAIGSTSAEGASAWTFSESQASQ